MAGKNMTGKTTRTNRGFGRLAPFATLGGVKKLAPEILAGITLAALMIPLNIGYAQVAGLPPIVGLYAAILPMIAFALFSTSRNLVAGPDAAIAALIGGLLSTLIAPTDPLYIQYSFALALLCALIFLFFWLFKLGFLANFLSHAVLVGFITGLGIEVLTSQIEKIMGVAVEADGYFYEVLALIQAVPAANWYAVAIGVGSIVIIRLLKRSVPRLPGALVALVLMTAVVAIFDLDARGVSVLGQIPAGLPALTLPQVSWGVYASLLPGALAICGITLAESLLIARKYAQKYHYPFDPDQEMFAFGAANAAAGLTGALVVGASASRTAAIDETGATSQWPSVVAAAVVALLLLFFTDLLALLPNAALGGIVANAVLSLIEVGELRELFRQRRSEFGIAIVALLSVLMLGALPAVAIAFLLSTIDLVRRAAAPKTAVLVQAPGGQDEFVGSGVGAAQTELGLVIYRFGAPLYFANAPLLLAEVTRQVEAAQPPLRWFVLNAEMINDIDVTGGRALGQVIKLLAERQITFAIARAHAPVPELLERYELLHLIGKDRLYHTNRAAVDAYRAATAVQQGTG